MCAQQSWNPAKSAPVASYNIVLFHCMHISISDTNGYQHTYKGAASSIPLKYESKHITYTALLDRQTSCDSIIVGSHFIKIVLIAGISILYIATFSLYTRVNDTQQ